MLRSNWFRANVGLAESASELITTLGLATGTSLTQTYSTANATHAARSASALTENSSAIGGTNDGDLPALVDPTGDSGASVIAGIRENATMINALVTDQQDTAQFVNSLVDALQSAGIVD